MGGEIKALLMDKSLPQNGKFMKSANKQWRQNCKMGHSLANTE